MTSDRVFVAPHVSGAREVRVRAKKPLRLAQANRSVFSSFLLNVTSHAQRALFGGPNVREKAEFNYQGASVLAFPLDEDFDQSGGMLVQIYSPLRAPEQFIIETRLESLGIEISWIDQRGFEIIFRGGEA